MNLPNKLTIVRVALIPVFVFFALWQFSRFNILIALAVFAIASYTDMLDGKIARRDNLITNFGKFLDPLADKALVMAALLVFVDMGWVSSIPVMIILFREFMVSALRLVVKSGDGVVIAAGWFGKVKTAFTMVEIIITLLIHGIMAGWCADISGGGLCYRRCACLDCGYPYRRLGRTVSLGIPQGNRPQRLINSDIAAKGIT